MEKKSALMVVTSIFGGYFILTVAGLIAARITGRDEAFVIC